MYICTLAPKYTLIGPARASLSAFAVQTNEKKLVKEVRNTTGSGLHTMLKMRGQHKIEWADVGASKVQKVEVIIKKYQRLTWRLINCELGVNREQPGMCRTSSRPRGVSYTFVG